MSYKRLGDYITQVNIRNVNGSITDLRGLSLTKNFRKSTSNIIGANMSKYKVIKQWQFSANFMGLGVLVNKAAIVLKTDKKPNIVSSAYPVFKVVDKNKLNPEYLMMWFRRSEFDRYCVFKSDKGIRGGFDWNDLCEVKLPIPSIEKQQQIVAEYNTVTNRINLNNQLNQKLEETAQALYKHWFVDFNFPITEESCSELVSESPHLIGKPYKSSGGEMVYNEELDKDIPFGWSDVKLGEITKITMGQSPKGESYNENESGTPLINGPVEFGNYFTVKTKWTTDPKKHCEIDDLILCVRGSTVGKYVMADDKYSIGRGVCSINSAYPFFNRQMVQFNLNEILKDVTGSTFPNLDRQTLENYLLTMSDNNLVKVFENSCDSLYKTVKFRFKENQTLQELQSLLLAKMTKVEAKTAVV